MYAQNSLSATNLSTGDRGADMAPAIQKALISRIADFLIIYWCWVRVLMCLFLKASYL